MRTKLPPYFDNLDILAEAAEMHNTIAPVTRTKNPKPRAMVSMSYKEFKEGKLQSLEQITEGLKKINIDKFSGLDWSDTDLIIINRPANNSGSIIYNLTKLQRTSEAQPKSITELRADHVLIRIFIYVLNMDNTEYTEQLKTIVPKLMHLLLTRLTDDDEMTRNAFRERLRLIHTMHACISKRH